MQQPTQAQKSQFTNHEKASCLKAYLFDGLSYRDLERDVLQIESPARGGGFKAQTMMRSFGLISANKGLFRGKTLDGAIRQANGTIKDVLKFIKDYVD